MSVGKGVYVQQRQRFVGEGPGGMCTYLGVRRRRVKPLRTSFGLRKACTKLSLDLDRTSMAIQPSCMPDPNFRTVLPTLFPLLFLLSYCHLWHVLRQPEAMWQWSCCHVLSRLIHQLKIPHLVLQVSALLDFGSNPSVVSKDLLALLNILAFE